MQRPEAGECHCVRTSRVQWWEGREPGAERGVGPSYVVQQLVVANSLLTVFFTFSCRLTSPLGE